MLRGWDQAFLHPNAAIHHAVGLRMAWLWVKKQDHTTKTKLGLLKPKTRDLYHTQ